MARKAIAKKTSKKVASKKGPARKVAAKKAAAKKVAAKASSTRAVNPWTKEDVRALKAHSKAKTPVAQVSKEMKRTVGALRRRAGILGIGLGERR